MRSKLVTNYLPEIFALGVFRSGPAMVTVNLTSRCNQKCIYCELSESTARRKEDVLTVEDLTWIIDQMAMHKIRKLSLCGGEPFLFDGIIDVVKYAGTKGIRCSITTNGMTAHLLDEKELDVLSKCKTSVNISIDSFSENIQSLTRGTDLALQRALQAIRRFTETGIPVTVLTVISKYNYNGLSAFITEAHRKGIRQVLLQPVICSSNYPELPAIGDKAGLNVGNEKLEPLMEELRKILRFERRHRIRTNVYRIYPWIRQYLETAANPDGTWFFKKVVKKFYCRELDAIIDISYDGGIQPCGLTQASVFIPGNRERGLIDLWSEATGKIREDLLAERYYNVCNGCCHHFSRNMLASVFKHPFRNLGTLAAILPLLMSRIWWGTVKKIYGK